MDGSAHTNLGILYYKVPGFPISFGNKNKAKSYLLEGIKLNPQGITSNYFYADFLISQGRYSDTIPFLKKALAAPNRNNRPIADEGCRKEIKVALTLAKSKVSK